MESACLVRALPLVAGFPRQVASFPLGFVSCCDSVLLCPVVYCYGSKMQLGGRFWIDTDTMLGSAHLQMFPE